MKKMFCVSAAALLTVAFTSVAWAQWSSDPMVNLALAANPNGSDQVQPKLLPLKQNGWYASWFDSNPSTSHPQGYDVFYQRLSSGGVEKFPQGGIMVADLTNSSTEDYGLGVDTDGNALIAFLDTREGIANQQVTASKMSPSGNALWSRHGVQLTNDSNFHAAPKIVGTIDGYIVVAWTSNSDVVLQKLDSEGIAQWGSGVTFSQTGYDYLLADLHAADDGSVIVSWVSNQGFGSNSQLWTNKVSSSGSLLWGSGNVNIFNVGSLQFGNFPYFVYDGNGGAVFAWYTSIPTLQCFAQHIRSDGSAAFPQNGVAGSGNTINVRVSPAATYSKATDEVFMFWTEEDSNQVLNGVYGQKFNSTGELEWGADGLSIVPLGADQQIFVSTVPVGSGALVFWVDMQSFGSSTIQATRLDDSGATVCAQFPVSSLPSDKARPVAAIAPSSIAAVAFEDDRTGNNGIYIQNVNPDCSLGQRQ